MNKYDLIDRVPTIHEFNDLRKSVEWSEFDEGTILKVLNSTVYSVCAVVDHKAIGMGRIIGDGAMYFYIQDMVVNPSFQGKGIGKGIMKKLLNYIKLNAKEGSLIGLMSAKDKEGFYRSFGFAERPNEKYGAGMFIYN